MGYTLEEKAAGNHNYINYADIMEGSTVINRYGYEKDQSGC